MNLGRSEIMLSAFQYPFPKHLKHLAKKKLGITKQNIGRETHSGTTMAEVEFLGRSLKLD